MVLDESMFMDEGLRRERTPAALVADMFVEMQGPRCGGALVRGRLAPGYIPPSSTGALSLVVWPGGAERAFLALPKVVADGSHVSRRNSSRAHVNVCYRRRSTFAPGAKSFFADFLARSSCVTPQVVQMVVVAWLGTASGSLSATSRRQCYLAAQSHFPQRRRRWRQYHLRRPRTAAAHRAGPRLGRPA